ncbi:hypothetical protein KEU06_09400 [Pseudaminobacter sp. 19-2017]|uniref:Uncharacterized protein n=1 Tax=Pseudaminobacter soli (ex Zhang et al. 2022) TaxID=2831468 RepID=A0A942E0V4_9HYPH|nr:hypothetical protein [Pseudaminobacter soli]MBS3648820.1 hypothetical protein [Pseudaminobacter soli]
MPLPSHLFIADDGALYDTREPNWAERALRPVYRKTAVTIHDVAELKATLRVGSHAWPGGYPLYIVLQDGSPITHDTARKNFRELVAAMWDENLRNDWRPVATGINWEDPDLYDAHTNERIPSAYAEPEEEAA